jgi:predicted RNA-binding Zn ribbon-like protein
MGAPRGPAECLTITLAVMSKTLMMVIMISDDAALLIGFLNTVHLPDGVDALDGSGPRQWVADGRVDSGRSEHADGHRTSARGGDALEPLRQLREGLRVMTRHVDDVGGEQRAQMTRAARALRSAPLVLRVPADATAGLDLVSAAPRPKRSDVLLAAVTTALLRSTADQTFLRVKTCARPECRWAFYDTSKNRSRRWCSMNGCGNVVNNRTYRARRAGS